MIVIGLGNKARQGKNFVAGAMRQYGAKLDMDVREYGFADALRAYCRVAFGMHKKDARLLQVVGTDVFRATNPNIWVNVLLDRLDEEAPDVAIITDVRFPNEYSLVKDYYRGSFVRVERRTPNGGPMLAVDRDPLHESETALDGVFTDSVISVLDGELGALTRAAQHEFDHFTR